MNEGAKVQQANSLTPELLRRAASFLATLDDDWARLVDAVGPCARAPKPQREPYEALIRAVSYRSAAACYLWRVPAARRGTLAPASSGAVLIQPQESEFLRQKDALSSST